MSVDFSSAKAWRRAKFMAKFVFALFGIVGAFAILMNATEGRPVLSPSFIIGGLVICLFFLAPWLLWWAFLRLSELSLGPVKRDE